MTRPAPDIIRELRTNLPENKKLLIAVSGGVDSMVLLYSCLQIAKGSGLHLEIAHYNHQQRESADRDQQLVFAFAKKNNTLLHIEALEELLPKGENIEAWLREKRYAFLESIRQKQKLDYILTAHHATDTAETLLIKLISNKHLSTICRKDPKRHLIRPFLSIPRKQIEQYAAEHKIPYYEDETNNDTRRLRNRIRHKVLPLLIKEFDPRIDEVLSHQAENIEEDFDFIHSLLEEHVQELEKLPSGSKDWLRRLTTILEKIHPALQWRLVAKLLINKLGFILGRESAKRLVRFIIDGNTAIELPGGTVLKRKNGGIEFIS